MRWDTYDPEIREHASMSPGGTALVDALVSALQIEPGQHILDLCPGNGLVAAVMAKELGVDVTCIADDPDHEARAEASARLLGVSDRVRVIPAGPSAIPVPAEDFHRVLCVGNPFLPIPTPELARELHRVLVADGVMGLAGPTSMSNDTPGYMRSSLSDFGTVILKTPAYTALLFSREGFHIVNAEYLPGSWDKWTEWLGIIPDESIFNALRRAIAEDGGQWLSLGLIVLRKPPKPSWAV